MIANITTDDAKFAREYIALGGDMNTSLKFSEMDGQTMLDTIAKEQKGLAKFIETIKSGIEIMAFPANISEVATRMQEYVKSRKAGKGTFTALENAGRLTAPFHHKGLMTKNAFAR